MRELYLPAGSRNVLNASIRWGTRTNTMVTLSRGGHAGFSDDERLTLDATCRVLGRLGDVGSDAGMPSSAPSPADFPNAQALTPRQRMVANLLADGLSNSQIARRLAISERTVKKHVTDLCARLGLSNRTAAAAWWTVHAV